ncbi:hypothetical protein SODALDRAFT_316507 [Sodiomyces alkalinus F11]|uniref:Uncharacterized protein n=1 Tax=Sodiomyces alkalinus (strain CBS 110278 / VKM F-3762 / F11) TaxID=1314773 RepID=A0A3N2PP13_SODAK|nr:hypothetical protein SODALDRAFT_316507 [Sodiomyces alkalinus F11]ROT36164.1 hypothetical protein SODALDRAFT_316507 [Sodiomyces alkalinus F11]
MRRHDSKLVSQTWRDCIAYCRAAIMAPKDHPSRASAPWVRSCSELQRELLSKYGPEIIEAARAGCAALINDRFEGQPHKIPHIDKKRSFLSNWHGQPVGDSLLPQRNILATAAYEAGALPCHLAMLAWGTPEQAARLSFISHVPICDDYASFTESDYEARIRHAALAVGAAYAFGGWAAEAIIDGSMLQATGTGTGLGTGEAGLIEGVMSWRAVNGATVPYTSYLFGKGTLAEGLIAPQVFTAVHDLFDWRSDTAARNHENGVTGVYGVLGVEDPFHVYLEAILETATLYPVHATWTTGAMTVGHYTAARYGTYDYRGKHDSCCDNCVRLLREATARANLAWKPEIPPRSFAEGHEYRNLLKRQIDQYEQHDMVQKGLSWFQHLVVTGEIWIFDLLREGVEPIDVEAYWV